MTKRKVPRVLRPAHGMTVKQHAFCLAYLSNNFNARQAYLTSHPGVSVAAAGVAAYRTLNIANVRLFLNERIEAAHKPLAMGAEQALARLANIAAFDLRDLFDPATGTMLPVQDWPDSVRSCVKGFTADGSKVLLESPLAALRTVLEITGRVKGLGDSLDQLADAIRADKVRRAVTP